MTCWSLITLHLSLFHGSSVALLCANDVRVLCMPTKPESLSFVIIRSHGKEGSRNRLVSLLPCLVCDYLNIGGEMGVYWPEALYQSADNYSRRSPRNDSSNRLDAAQVFKSLAATTHFGFCKNFRLMRPKKIPFFPLNESFILRLASSALTANCTAYSISSTAQ